MVVSQTDIAIIGGGAQGLMLAYYAKKGYPQKSVVLLESGLIGQGITAFSAHLHTPYGEGDKNLLTRISLDLYRDLLIEYPDFPLEEKEFIGVCKKANVDKIVSSLVVKNTSINSLRYPFSNLSDEYVLLSGMKCMVTKRTFASYLMEIISSMGVKLYEGVTIDSVKKVGKRFQLRDSRSEIGLNAGVVFNCSGAGILKLLEGRYRCKTKKIVALHVDRPATSLDPVYYFFEEDAFLLPQHGYNRYLFCYRGEIWDVDPDMDIHITNDDIRAAKEILQKYSDFSEQVLGGQVYFDVYNVPSSSPIIDKLDDLFFTVGGTGGSGVRLAPALALKALNQISNDNF
jgi:glycine/D-amino acid oxidase-like deaminating enzyme